MSNRVHGKRILRRRADIQQETNYQNYRDNLRLDFQDICGYCGKSIYVSRLQFEIDHLEPKSIAPRKEHDYHNLVYACFQCNRKKYNNTNFIDPASEEYDHHLKRENDGAIITLTDVGVYMAKKFKFESRPIRELWKVMLLREKQELLLQKPYNELSELEKEALYNITKGLEEFMKLFIINRE